MICLIVQVKQLFNPFLREWFQKWQNASQVQDQQLWLVSSVWQALSFESCDPEFKITSNDCLLQSVASIVMRCDLYNSGSVAEDARFRVIVHSLWHLAFIAQKQWGRNANPKPKISGGGMPSLEQGLDIYGIYELEHQLSGYKACVPQCKFSTCDITTPDHGLSNDRMYISEYMLYSWRKQLQSKLLTLQ